MLAMINAFEALSDSPGSIKTFRKQEPIETARRSLARQHTESRSTAIDAGSSVFAIPV